jgi:hypothetical protein
MLGGTWPSDLERCGSVLKVAGLSPSWSSEAAFHFVKVFPLREVAVREHPIVVDFLLCYPDNAPFSLRL